MVHGLDWHFEHWASFVDQSKATGDIIHNQSALVWPKSKPTAPSSHTSSNPGEKTTTKKHWSNTQPTTRGRSCYRDSCSFIPYIIAYLLFKNDTFSLWTECMRSIEQVGASPQFCACRGPSHQHRVSGLCADWEPPTHPGFSKVLSERKCAAGWGAPSGCEEKTRTYSRISISCDNKVAHSYLFYMSHDRLFQERKACPSNLQTSLQWEQTLALTDPTALSW